MTKISKPEKVALSSIKYNNDGDCCLEKSGCYGDYNQWQAFHDQEMKEVLDGIEDIINQIEEEIARNPSKPNLGKKGCLARLNALLNKHREEMK